MSESQDVNIAGIEYDGEELKAVTMEKLAAIIASEFEKEGKLGSLPRMVFLVHRWYMESSTLANVLIDVYAKAHDRQCDKRLGVNLKRGVARAFKFWIDEFPEHYQHNEELVKILRSFRKRVGSEGLKDLQPLLQWSSERHEHVVHPPVYLSVHSSPATSPERRVSYSFNSVNAKSIAAHLTLLDHEAFRNIPFDEWASYGRNGKPFDCPRIQEAIVLFNGISCWVQSKTLSELTPALRAQIMGKYIEVAQHLRSLKNYNSLVAVVGGLNSSSLSRLKHTIDSLSSKHKASLEELTAAVSSDSNYAAYRKGLEPNGSKPCFTLPAIGVCLKDLIAVHVALKDKTGNGLVNLRKLTQLYQLFNDIHRFQKVPPPVASEKDRLDILRISVQPRFSEEELYQVSLAREPRSQKNPEDSATMPARSPLFGDWTAGIDANVDELMLRKYIEAMVDAVFKTYDTDHNGFISMEEFQDLSSNFPFLDSFAALDTNSDGVISHQELSDYFFQANLPLMRRSFSHVFHEASYLSPTFCYHCKGLLWGLIKQGWKCRNCGVNCHRHCRDVVVAECRRETVQNTTPTLRRKIVSRRKLSSSSYAKKQNRASDASVEYNDWRQNYSRLEETHGLVIAENARLKFRLKEKENALEEAQRQIDDLRKELVTVREGTIDYVLRHMGEFSKTRSTDV